MYVYIQEDMEKIASEKSVWAHEIMGQTRLFEQIVIKLIAEAMENGELRSDIPVMLAANAVFGMLNWTHRWYNPEDHYSAGDVSEAFSRIFFDGMTRPHPEPSALSRRSEEHTSELQSLMRISYAVSCLKTKNKHQPR